MIGVPAQRIIKMRNALYQRYRERTAGLAAGHDFDEEHSGSNSAHIEIPEQNCSLHWFKFED